MAALLKALLSLPCIGSNFRRRKTIYTCPGVENPSVLGYLSLNVAYWKTSLNSKKIWAYTSPFSYAHLSPWELLSLGAWLVHVQLPDSCMQSSMVSLPTLALQFQFGCFANLEVRCMRALLFYPTGRFSPIKHYVWHPSERVYAQLILAS